MTDNAHMGYETMVTRLKRVQQFLGRERALSILAEHGVSTVGDVHPRIYPGVIAHAEFVVANALAWEKLIGARDFMCSRSHSASHIVLTVHPYHEAIDTWFEACDKELRLMNKGLYNDRGEPK